MFVILIVHRFKVSVLLSDLKIFEDHHGDSCPRFLFEEIKNKIDFIQNVLTSVKTQVIFRMYYLFLFLFKFYFISYLLFSTVSD